MGIGTAALALPAKAIAAKYPWGWKYRHFDPRQQYGDMIRITDVVTDAPDDYVRIELLEILKEQMAEVIPPEFRDHVRYAFINPTIPSRHDPLGQFGFATWKYTINRPMKGERVVVQ